MQLELPDVQVLFWPGHSWHVVAPLVFWNVPMKQLLHAELIMLAENFPSSQFLHTETFMAPASSEYFPGPQDKQAVEAFPHA